MEANKQCVSEQLHYRSNSDCAKDIQRSEEYNHGKEGYEESSFSIVKLDYLTY